MILGYVRCSTSDQCKDNRSSLQTQTDIIEGIARIRGADKFGVQLYTDAGISGATKLQYRPAGEKLIADMAAGDVVIASKLDRMFRSAANAIDMFEEFNKRGVELILYDISPEPISSGVGKLIMTILAAVADMERIRIRERTADGRKAKRARGGAVGEAPFGYRQVGTGREAMLETNERELEAATLMRELYPKASLRQVSAALAEAGYVSRSGKPYAPEVIRRQTMEAVQ